MEIILSIALIGMVFAFSYVAKENRRLEELLVAESKKRHPAYRNRMEDAL